MQMLYYICIDMKQSKAITYCFIIVFLNMYVISCEKKGNAVRQVYSVMDKICGEEEYANALSVLQEQYDNTGLFREIWNYATRQNDISGIVECMELMQGADSVAGLTDHSVFYRELYVCAYLAQAYLYTGQYDKCVSCLDKGRQLLEDEYDNETYNVEGMIYNLSAILVMKQEYNYIEAIDYLKKAVCAAEVSNDSLTKCTYLCNISNIYYIREDPAGVEYAREAYRISSDLQDINLRSIAALSLSVMCFLNADIEGAIKYAEESTGYTSHPDFFINHKAAVFLNMAEINRAYGNTNVADEYYMKSMKFQQWSEESIVIKLYWSYGDFKLYQKQYDEAITYFLLAKNMYESNDNIEFKHHILYGLSQAMKMTGHYQMANRYLEESMAAYRQIITFRKEQDFTNLKLKYEEAKYEEEINKKELEILKKNYNLYIILFISAIISILLVYSYILYRKKNSMYKNMVRQNYSYRKELEEYKNIERIRNDEKTRQDNISRLKMELFEKIEKLMNEEKLYRRKDLTVENLAEVLGTNITYVSNVINNLSGKTFPAYLHAFRLKEVLENLSDISNEESINAIFDKAGYSSRATYTRIFQKEIGCTPSKYREQMRKIGKGDI